MRLAPRLIERAFGFFRKPDFFRMSKGRCGGAEMHAEAVLFTVEIERQIEIRGQAAERGRQIGQRISLKAYFDHVPPDDRNASIGQAGIDAAADIDRQTVGA